MPPLSKKRKSGDGNSPPATSQLAPERFIQVMQKISPLLADATRCLEMPLLFSESHFFKILTSIRFDCEQVLDILKENDVTFPEPVVNLGLHEPVGEEDSPENDSLDFADPGSTDSGVHTETLTAEISDPMASVVSSVQAPPVDIGAFNDDDTKLFLDSLDPKEEFDPDSALTVYNADAAQTRLDADIIKVERDDSRMENDVKEELDDAVTGPTEVAGMEADESDPIEVMNDQNEDVDDALSGFGDDVTDEKARELHCTLLKRPNKIRYWCKICHSVYSIKCGNDTATPTAAEIAEHLASRKCKESQEIDKCEHCAELGIDFSDIQMRIKNHRRAHMPPFHCKKCKYICQTVQEMRDHVKKHLGKYIRCPKCYKTFASKDALIAHFPKKHGEKYQQREGTAACFLCFKDVTVSIQYTAHIRSHIKLDNGIERKPHHKCPHCDFQARLYPSLVGHEKVHLLPYMCSKCDFKADSIAEFKEHWQDLHMQPEDRKLTCELCNKHFVSKEALLGHIDFHDRKKDEENQQTKGLKYKPVLLRYGSFKCFVCDEDVYRMHYNVHIRSHIRFRGHSIKCQVCTAEFGTRTLLRHHVAAVHDKVRRFHCHACSFSSYSKPSLTFHIKAKHEGGAKGPQKRYPCPLPKCRKSFNHKETYDQHLALHAEKRTKPMSFYHCQKCGMGFTRVANLYRHAHTTQHPIPDQDLMKFNEPKPKPPKPPRQPKEPKVSKAAPKEEKLRKNGEPFAKKRCQKWTHQEDDWICTGVRELGKGCWKEILEKYSQHFHVSRDRFTIRLRYAYLEKMGLAREGVLKPGVETNDRRRCPTPSPSKAGHLSGSENAPTAHSSVSPSQALTPNVDQHQPPMRGEDGHSPSETSTARYADAIPEYV